MHEFGGVEALGVKEFQRTIDLFPLRIFLRGSADRPVHGLGVCIGIQHLGLYRDTEGQGWEGSDVKLLNRDIVLIDEYGYRLVIETNPWSMCGYR